MSDLFDEVRKVIAARGEVYGPSREHWAATAAVWTVLLAGRLRTGKTITPADVARLYIADKLVRDTSTPLVDNVIDICGYAFGLGEIRGLE